MKGFESNKRLACGDLMFGKTSGNLELREAWNLVASGETFALRLWINSKLVNKSRLPRCEIEDASNFIAESEIVAPESKQAMSNFDHGLLTLPIVLRRLVGFSSTDIFQTFYSLVSDIISLVYMSVKKLFVSECRAAKSVSKLACPICCKQPRRYFPFLIDLQRTHNLN